MNWETYLKEIEAREKAATPGHWESRCDNTLDNHAQPRMVWAEYGFVAKCLLPASYAVPDAELIAHARTDIPKLIARVRELELGLKDLCRAYYNEVKDVRDPDLNRAEEVLSREVEE